MNALTDGEFDFLAYMQDKHGESHPLVRNLMSKLEIKKANRLVKCGMLMKGRTDDRQKTVMYYAVTK